MVICHSLIDCGHGCPSFVSVGYSWWLAVAVGCGVFALWWQPMMDRVGSTKSGVLGNGVPGFECQTGGRGGGGP